MSTSSRQSLAVLLATKPRTNKKMHNKTTNKTKPKNEQTLSHLSS